MSDPLKNLLTTKTSVLDTRHSADTENDHDGDDIVEAVGKVPTKEGDVKLKRGINKKRHLTCHTNYRPIRESKLWKNSTTFSGEERKVTFNTKASKAAWENHVLEQLSTQTRDFIKCRFEGHEEPKDKLNDFVSEQYSDKDREDYLHRRKHRLFDLCYEESATPGISIHL